MWQKYDPFRETLRHNEGAINTFLIGNSLMAISFFVIAIIFFLYVKYSRSKPVTTWFAWWLLLLCALRLMEVVSLWVAYYNFMSVLVALGGFVSVITMTLIIYVVNGIKKLETVAALQQQVAEQEVRLETLKKLKEENDGTTTTSDMV